MDITKDPAPILKNIYFNTLQNCRYTFKNGKDANFLNGQYVTDIRSEIDELDAEVEFGHPHIYVDANKRQIDVQFRDPVEAIKRQAIAEFLAQQKEATNKANDMGTTSQAGRVIEGIANSNTVGEAASESSSFASAPAVGSGTQSGAGVATSANTATAAAPATSTVSATSGLPAGAMAALAALKSK